MSVAEGAIRAQGMGERVIGERENLCASERGVIELNNTVEMNDNNFSLILCPQVMKLCRLT